MTKPVAIYLLPAVCQAFYMTGIILESYIIILHLVIAITLQDVS